MADRAGELPPQEEQGHDGAAIDGEVVPAPSSADADAGLVDVPLDGPADEPALVQARASEGGVEDVPLDGPADDVVTMAPDAAQEELSAAQPPAAASASAEEAAEEDVAPAAVGLHELASSEARVEPTAVEAAPAAPPAAPPAASSPAGEAAGGAGGGGGILLGHGAYPEGGPPAPAAGAAAAPSPEASAARGVGSSPLPGDGDWPVAGQAAATAAAPFPAASNEGPGASLAGAGDWPEAGQAASAPSSAEGLLGGWPEATEVGSFTGLRSPAASGSGWPEAVSPDRLGGGGGATSSTAAGGISLGPSAASGAPGVGAARGQVLAPPVPAASPDETASGLRRLIAQLEAQLAEEVRRREVEEAELEARDAEKKRLLAELEAHRMRREGAAAAAKSAEKMSEATERQHAELAKQHRALRAEVAQQEEELERLREAARVRSGAGRDWARDGPEKDALVETKLKIAEAHDRLAQMKQQLWLNREGLRKQLSELQAENARLRSGRWSGGGQPAASAAPTS